MKEQNSYHDLFIATADMRRTSIFNLPFGLTVACTRTGGWQLWRKEGDEQKLIAGEYDENWLVLDVKGHTIVDSRKPGGTQR